MGLFGFSAHQWQRSTVCDVCKQGAPLEAGHTAHLLPIIFQSSILLHEKQTDDPATGLSV